MIAHVQCLTYVYVSIKISTKYTIEQYDIFELKTHKVQIQMYIYIKLVWNAHYKIYWYILSNGGSIGCMLLVKY